MGLGRFELPTSRLSGVHSNQLSYRPPRLPSSKKAPETILGQGETNGGSAGVSPGQQDPRIHTGALRARNLMISGKPVNPLIISPLNKTVGDCYNERRL